MGLMVLMAGLLFITVPAKAEMYVAAYLGGAFGANAGSEVSFTSHTTLTPGGAPLSMSGMAHTPGKIDPAQFSAV